MSTWVKVIRILSLLCAAIMGVLMLFMLLMGDKPDLKTVAWFLIAIVLSFAAKPSRGPEDS